MFYYDNSDAVKSVWNKADMYLTAIKLVLQDLIQK